MVPCYSVVATANEDELLLPCSIYMDFALLRTTLLAIVKLRYFPKVYVQEFMAESLSFLLRNPSLQQLKKGGTTYSDDGWYLRVFLHQNFLRSNTNAWEEDELPFIMNGDSVQFGCMFG